MAALRQAWAGLDTGARRSMAVRAAVVSAFCACDSLGDASHALNELLDLYAVLARSGARVPQPASFGGSPGGDAAEAQPVSMGGPEDSWVGGTSAEGAAVHSLERAALAVQATAELDEGALAAPDDKIFSSGSTVSTHESEAAGASGGDSRGHNAPQQEVWESLEDARRAAAQACHQLIHAAGRLGAADVAHEAALAMHQARAGSRTLACIALHVHRPCPGVQESYLFSKCVASRNSEFWLGTSPTQKLCSSRCLGERCHQQ